MLSGVIERKYLNNSGEEIGQKVGERVRVLYAESARSEMPSDLGASLGREVARPVPVGRAASLFRGVCCPSER